MMERMLKFHFQNIEKIILSDAGQKIYAKLQEVAADCNAKAVHVWDISERCDVFMFPSHNSNGQMLIDMQIIEASQNDEQRIFDVDYFTAMTCIADKFIWGGEILITASNESWREWMR